MNDNPPERPVDDADYVALQRFLAREAALLDRRQFDEWLALVAEDVFYRVTVQVTREATLGHAAYAIIEEGFDGLKSRLAQIGTPRLTRAENPPSHTRRFVTNLQACYAGGRDEMIVESNLLVYRGRTTQPEGGFYVGERRDLVRRGGGKLLLARREVRLDHDVIMGGPVSTVF